MYFTELCIILNIKSFQLDCIVPDSLSNNWQAMHLHKTELIRWRKMQIDNHDQGIQLKLVHPVIFPLA